MVDTHMLWVRGNLSAVERLCVESFVRQDFKVILWTYGGLDNCPEGAQLRDAREILSESEIFLNRQGSLAGFSDYFRYAVLSKIGGLYVDTDVYALKPAHMMQTQKYLVSERVPNVPHQVKINPNVMFNPSPERGDIVDLAFAYSSRFKKTEVNWGEIGPELLTAICSIYPTHGYEIKDPMYANPIDWWACPEALLMPNLRLETEKVQFVHLFTSMWKRKQVGKDIHFPKESIMALIAEGKFG